VLWRLEIDNQFEPRWLLNWKIDRTLAFDYLSTKDAIGRKTLTAP